jgi:nucleolar protein 56
MATFVLFECAAGYGLFELVNFDKVGAEEVQSSVTDLQRFSKYIKLVGFQPFESAEDALANINAISEGILDDSLLNFLELNLPKVSKKPGKEPTAFALGVVAPNLVQSIKNATNIRCVCDETIREVTRGIRLHLDHLIQALGGGLMRQSQLGLSHSYSRAKVKFNINRSDNMIIQAIALVDQMDKDLNTFAMRVREWCVFMSRVCVCVCVCVVCALCVYACVYVLMCVWSCCSSSAAWAMLLAAAVTSSIGIHRVL